VCEEIERGSSAGEAARSGISTLADRVDGLGGLICIDRSETVAFHFNTPRMAVAWIGPNGVEGVQV
jgi:isoaspartyl peptidase/L-asparaginase-like protein (Ntn-hydrolase superfamily)